jgi:hypothetical protein
MVGMKEHPARAGAQASEGSAPECESRSDRIGSCCTRVLYRRKRHCHMVYELLL